MPSDLRRSVINQDVLPENFPRHRHAGAFWEALGRTIAAFGFLEETIAKAIFAFTGTREIPADKIEAEFEKLLSTLQKALSDPLGGLIEAYGKAARQHPMRHLPTFRLFSAICEKSPSCATCCATARGAFRMPGVDQSHTMLTVRTASSKRRSTSPISIRLAGTSLSSHAL